MYSIFSLTLDLGLEREKDNQVLIWEQILSVVELLNTVDLCYFLINTEVFEMRRFVQRTSS